MSLNDALDTQLSTSVMVFPLRFQLNCGASWNIFDGLLGGGATGIVGGFPLAGTT